jgi:hypothetical protein
MSVAAYNAAPSFAPVNIHGETEPRPSVHAPRDETQHSRATRLSALVARFRFEELHRRYAAGHRTLGLTGAAPGVDQMPRPALQYRTSSIVQNGSDSTRERTSTRTPESGSDVMPVSA